MTISIGGHGTANTTFSTGITTNSTTTTGGANSVFLVGQWNASSTNLGTISDTQGNSYTLLLQGTFNSASEVASLYICNSPVGGSGFTWTCSFGAGNNLTATMFGVEVLGVSGTDGSSVVDREVTSSPGGTAITTTNAVDAIISMFGGVDGTQQAGNTITNNTGAGWALIDSSVSSAGGLLPGASSYLITSAVGSYADTYTISPGSMSSVVFTVALKQAAVIPVQASYALENFMEF